MKLDAATIAVLEEHAQATIDFATRLKLGCAPDSIHPAAIVALERAIADRLAEGLSGYVLLRVDAAPGRPHRWKVVDGERVLETGVDDRGAA